ncbi:RNA-dependent DNA polymerase (plasmid) [Moritella sp. 24]|uniref:reverse transcriptase/maturase family protein n=1 Tax=Moritella sp. 24 TaxID=2746230 RepID=UPI001BA49B12|nr:reverse transcriptase/maturase family protein [Moritella sp. 24]QUM78715.1 RNA-dependent DNA polymerase [Moritella sp. 24]
MITRSPLRGGNWNNGSNAGLGALNLNNARTNANNNIGFRPALDYARSSFPTGGCQCKFEKDAGTSAIAETLYTSIDASIECAYEEIYAFENLLSAAYSCRKGKSKNQSVMKFFDNLEENIIQIQNELMWCEYAPSPYHQFFVFEPKRRLISAPNFKDRVVHRAIYNIIEPHFDKTYIYDSYACRRGKGTHKGADRAQAFIRNVERKSNKAYALKADIYHYFSSIDHGILKQILSKKIKCQKTLSLLGFIIDTSPADEVGVGIPLGNLTSQMFANIYLNELDRYAKHYLKEKYYIRYMDDFVFIGPDKDKLHGIRVDVEKFLWEQLRLKTNSKTQVFPIAKERGRALDFLGFRIYATHRLLRKSSVKRIKSNLKKLRKGYAAGSVTIREMQQSVQSWLGHAKHAQTYNLRRTLFSVPFIKKPE